MTKFDKYIFAISLFIIFFFYGFVNISFYLGIPTYLVSGGGRLVSLFCGLYLFVKDCRRRQYVGMGFSVWVYIILALMTLASFALDDWRAYGGGYIELMGGKKYMLYIIFIASMGTFFTFFCGRDRFDFMMANPLLFYIPALLSVLVVILLNRGAFLTFNMGGSEMYGLSRSQTKESAVNILFISMYLFLFGKGLFQKLILGGGGVALAFANALINESRSILVSMGFAVLFYILVSIRSIQSLLMCIMGGILFVVVGAPFFVRARGFERLTNLLFIEDDYIAGATSLSRIEMIKDAFNTFLNSPIIWGTRFLGGSHLLITEILVATGIIGVFCYLAILVSTGIDSLEMIKRAMFGAPNHTGIFFVVALIIIDFTQSLFHGYTYDVFGACHIPLLLSISIYYRFYRYRCHYM